MHDNSETKLQRERASANLRELLKENPTLQTQIGTSKEALIALGKQLWPLTYKGTDSDSQAFTRFCVALEMGKGLLFHPIFADAMQYLPMEQLASIWSARWADQAFPVLAMGHKYAASLMATSIPSEYAAEIIPPFKAFMIEIPNGLIDVRDDQGVSWNVRYALVQFLENIPGVFVWNYVLITEGSITLWRHGVPTNLLTEAKPEHVTSWEDYSFSFKIDSHDDRVNVVIGRLILGACLALSSKDSSKPIGKSHSCPSGSLRTSPEPLVRVFQLGRPIVVDCRQTIKDYLSGEKHSAPSVQKLVRGHWQRQPYGAQSSLRKWIQKEPYWRGPEGAPILQRAMHLKGV